MQRSSFLSSAFVKPFIPALMFAICFQQCTKPESMNDVVNSSLDVSAINTAKIPEGTYKINVAGYASKAMALFTASIDEKIAVSIKEYNTDSTDRLWHITPINNYYRISNAYSGKVLTATGFKAGNPLTQNWYDTADAQLWQIKLISKNTYSLVSKNSGFCAGVVLNGSNRGIVQQQEVNNQPNQLWNITPVTAIYSDVDANNFFRRTKGWIASDGAASAELNDGRIAWFMGDSHIDDYYPAPKKVACLFQVRNAVLLQPASQSWHWPLTQTLTGNPFPGFQSYFKNKASDDYFMWPGCGVQVDNNDTLYVYNQPLKKTGGGVWDWADDSLPVWAKVRTADMKVVKYSYLQDFNGINFGMGYVKESDGYVYAFGSRQTFIYANFYVARFPASNPNAKWSFWNGSGWTSDVKDIKRISEGASNGTVVTKYNDFYIAISTEFSVGCDQGTVIYASVGKNPQGPFTKRKEFYRIPDRLQGHSPFFYAPNAHPQFKNAADELLITYDVNGYGDCVNTCNSNGLMDPDIYRPKAIRVPYSLITK